MLDSNGRGRLPCLDAMATPRLTMSIYSECWCSQSLSGISKKLDDGQCNFPCEGDNTTACGGALKLTVYRLSSASNKATGSALLASLGIALALFL